MSIIEQLAARLSPEDALYYDWQYELARRISQILEECGITQREFAKRARLTEAQVSALLHCGANPTLGMLARISALLESELLTWKNSDLDAKSDAPVSETRAKLATVYPLTSGNVLPATDASTETTSATSGYPYTYAQVALS